MAYGAQLPIRLDPVVEKKLDGIAKKSGTTKSALIRLLATTFVSHAVLPDGTINLPPNWESLLPEADGRSSSNAGSPGEVSDQGADIARKIRKKKFGK